jgi:hypothetical protein
MPSSSCAVLDPAYNASLAIRAIAKPLAAA